MEEVSGLLFVWIVMLSLAAIAAARGVLELYLWVMKEAGTRH